MPYQIFQSENHKVLLSPTEVETKFGDRVSHENTRYIIIRVGKEFSHKSKNEYHIVFNHDAGLAYARVIANTDKEPFLRSIADILKPIVMDAKGIDKVAGDFDITFAGGKLNYHTFLRDNGTVFERLNLEIDGELVFSGSNAAKYDHFKKLLPQENFKSEEQLLNFFEKWKKGDFGSGGGKFTDDKAKQYLNSAVTVVMFICLFVLLVMQCGGEG